MTAPGWSFSSHATLNDGAQQNTNAIQRLQSLKAPDEGDAGIANACPRRVLYPIRSSWREHGVSKALIRPNSEAPVTNVCFTTSVVNWPSVPNDLEPSKASPSEKWQRSDQQSAYFEHSDGAPSNGNLNSRLLLAGQQVLRKILKDEVGKGRAGIVADSLRVRFFRGTLLRRAEFLAPGVQPEVGMQHGGSAAESHGELLDEMKALEIRVIPLLVGVDSIHGFTDPPSASPDSSPTHPPSCGKKFSRNLCSVPVAIPAAAMASCLTSMLQVRAPWRYDRLPFPTLG
ncbi:hypothetical protein QBC37DRAFT_407228 [Rhypophila decipiens]|uniref:Uncharacterized protein n=1 Tax=Rhypophila decipiens TaxID=261697 RepID=A0AAN6XTH4_9PEZI|nr:hypothetical protein QBC37DRAFT_407228 [Rhypophila decipiens]